MPWMVAYDNNSFGMWLPDFWAILTTLPAHQIAFFGTTSIILLQATSWA